MKRVLVTGAGGVSGTNFVRALRAAPEKLYLVGTDYNPYYLNFPDVDVQYKTPRHDDPSFIPKIRKIVRKESIDFLHPNPEVEAYVVALNKNKFPVKIFLPTANTMSICKDKYLTAKILMKHNLSPCTKLVTSEDDIDEAFNSWSPPLWVRVREGAGGLGGLKCDNPEEAKTWIEIWKRKKGKKLRDFIIQEYLPGRDLAWDSLWKEGRLIASYARERLEYAFKHLTFSGIAGTPSIARIVRDSAVNKAATRAIQLVDKKPNGIYCVDLREDPHRVPKITEIGTKVHTTLGLWSYIGTKILDLPWYTNLAYLYLYLAFQEDAPKISEYDIYPEGYYLIRHIDSGVILWREDGWKKRVF
jgi:biotin carboxylase